MSSEEKLQAQAQITRFFALLRMTRHRVQRFCNTGFSFAFCTYVLNIRLRENGSRFGVAINRQEMQPQALECDGIRKDTASPMKILTSAKKKGGLRETAFFEEACAKRPVG